MLAAQGSSAPVTDAPSPTGMGQIAQRDRAPASSTGAWSSRTFTLNIEARLTQHRRRRQSGLHTGRRATTRSPPTSRLWLRDEIDHRRAARGAAARAGRAGDAHARDRDPARLHPPAGGAAGELCHHLLAYVEMFARDAERMADVRRASTACRWAPRRWPAPATRWTARRAWRATPAWRPVPEQPGRGERPRLRDRVRCRGDLDGPRLAPGEELMLWMSQSFGFIDPPTASAPAASIMPQKKNPTSPNWRAGRPAASSAT